MRKILGNQATLPIMHAGIFLRHLWKILLRLSRFAVRWNRLDFTRSKFAIKEYCNCILPAFRQFQIVIPDFGKNILSSDKDEIRSHVVSSWAAAAAILIDQLYMQHINNNRMRSMHETYQSLL